MGEGAGVCILESLEHAKRRGARVYCEVAGYGITGDAYHMSAPAPEGEGAARSMEMALRHARLNPDQIDYHQRPRHLHARRRQVRDPGDQEGLRRACRNSSPVSSTKSMTGHLLGAAGARRNGDLRDGHPATTSCRRRSTTNIPTLSATSITCRTKRGK